jgi:hypothetical protein
MAEAQSLQARMQRHMARNAAMSDAMQAAAQQVRPLSCVCKPVSRHSTSAGLGLLFLWNTSKWGWIGSTD